MAQEDIREINVRGVLYPIGSAANHNLGIVETKQLSANNYEADELLVYNGGTYRTTRQIVKNDTLLIDDNIKKSTVNDWVKLLLSKVKETITTLSNTKVSKMSNQDGYIKINAVGYNPTTKRLGLSVEIGGADTVIPFSGAVKLIPINFSNRYNVPTEEGRLYIGTFHRGGAGYERGYTVLKGIGTALIVRATANAITGAGHGDDVNYGSWVESLYLIDGELEW